MDEWELYDLQSDPSEMRSVYGAAEMAAVQTRLMAELARQRRILKVPDVDPPASIGGGRDNATSRVIRARQKESSDK